MSRYDSILSAIIVAPHVNYALDPHTRVYNPHHVISRLSLLYKWMSIHESVSDRRRQLTRQRVQRHRGRTDEARRETVRAADHKRKRLGRQNEVDVCHSQRFTIAREHAGS